MASAAGATKASRMAGYALQNAANSFSVSLPRELGTTPVRAGSGERWVQFSLRGAASQSPAVDGAKATYRGALAGVDVSYSVTNQGLKEELVLASAEAPASYDFSVGMSPGLSAEATPDGGIAFVDSAGTRWAGFAPPFVHDASYPQSGLEEGFSTEAVSLSIVATSPELIIRLAVDPNWLVEPSRAWPVTVDPSLQFALGPDTFVTNRYPTSNFGTNPSLFIFGGSAAYRVLHKSERDFSTFFTEPVEVASASFKLYADTDTTADAPQAVGVHSVTSDWAEGEATWNQRRAGVAWSTPGGDFDPQPAAVNASISGPPGYRSWNITALARRWAAGEQAYKGLLVKYENEATGPTKSFRSADASNAPPNSYPHVSITWEPLTSLRDPYRFETFSLGERRSASVNVASGNLVVHEQDLALAGVGLPATVERRYVARSGNTTSLASGWQMWPQSLEKLTISSLGDFVYWRGGPWAYLSFDRNPDGTFTSAPGVRATMATGPDGSYRLTLHEDGTVYGFDANGFPQSVTDRNGNRITFGYTFVPERNRSEMTSMTDTFGRVSTFERTDYNQVTRVTDPAGRLYRYGYGPDAQGVTRLTSYTDPDNKTTRYEYAGGYLSKIIDPNGNVTTFGYAARPRVAGTSSDYDGSQQLVRLTRVTDPVAGTGPAWSFDYSTPWQTKVTDPRGNPTTYFFDRLGRVTRTLNALGQEASATYSSNSFVTSTTDPLRAKTSFTYDARDNLTAVTSPTGAGHGFAYDDPAHPFYPTSHTGPSGSRLAYTYDGPGNLTTSENGLPTGQNQARRTYNPNGTVATATDALNRVTSYSYDANGNLTRITPPAPLGATSLTYDGLSRVSTVTDGKG